MPERQRVPGDARDVHRVLGLHRAVHVQPASAASCRRYSWFPNSFIQNNEPQFAAEFRTSFKNDTILLRPYTHLINRYISGAFENHYPGNGGGWYAVTNVANCQADLADPGDRRTGNGRERTVLRGST